LKKELESYKLDKPWREDQFEELEEKREKEEKSKDDSDE